jgi:hypothetical protein
VFFNHSTLPFAAVQNDSRNVPLGLPPILQQSISLFFCQFSIYIGVILRSNIECTPITQQPVETRVSVTTALSTVSNKKQTQVKIITVLHYLGIATFTTPDTERSIFRPVTLGQQVVTISSPTTLFLILVKTGFKQI